MKIKSRQESGIELKMQEKGSLCDAFLLLENYTECLFSFVSIRMQDIRGRKRTSMVNHYRIRMTWLCFFSSYIPFLTVNSFEKK